MVPVFASVSSHPSSPSPLQTQAWAAGNSGNSVAVCHAKGFHHCMVVAYRNCWSMSCCAIAPGGSARAGDTTYLHQ